MGVAEGKVGCGPRAPTRCATKWLTEGHVGGMRHANVHAHAYAHAHAHVHVRIFYTCHVLVHGLLHGHGSGSRYTAQNGLVI